MMGLWSGLVQSLGRILAVFYAVVPVYGIDIILLTIAINLVVLPLTWRRLRATVKMQQLQPEVKRLRERWKGDRQRLNEELRKLYMEEGVNPAAGCLPMLIQIPVFIALYRVLRGSIDAVPQSSALHDALASGNTGFLGLDLLLSPRAASDHGFWTVAPYLMLVLLVVATAALQQRLVTNTSPQGPGYGTVQRVMRWYPLVFGFISWRMPAGLLVYWATSQSVRAGQQQLIVTRQRSPGDESGDPTSDGESETPRRWLTWDRQWRRKRDRDDEDDNE